MKRFTIAGAIWGLLLGSVACGPVDPGDSDAAEDGTLGTSVERVSEQLGGITERIVRRYWSNPELAFTSYAIGHTGCNATLIGPNILMSAAHCGGPSTATFRLYRDGLLSPPETETFNCRYLQHTFGCPPWGPCNAIDSDLMLNFCEPNASGVNPGDKYGYLDFDPIPSPSVGMPVYSVWANSNETPTVPYGGLVYSAGSIESNTDPKEFLWSVPAGHPNSGIWTNVWTEGGASGSAQLNAGSHKIVIGPLSVGYNDAPGRGAVSAWDYFMWGYASSQSPATVDTAYVSSFGLTASNYYGWVDKNVDFVFDIQADLEARRGEARRGFYNLGFDSARRNSLWSKFGTTINAQTALARVSRPSGAAAVNTLTHARLNLPPATPFRIGVRSFTNVSSGLWLGFYKNGAYYSGTWLNTNSHSWKTNTFQISTPSVEGVSLVFYANAGFHDVHFKDLTLTALNESMDFESGDKRARWFNGVTGGRARVLPGGTTSGPGWAALVIREPSSGYAVVNRELALVAGQPYRICFDTRGGSAFPDPSYSGEMRVSSSGSVAGNVTFTPSVSWQRTCSGSITPSTSDNSVEFRASGQAFFGAQPNYWLDNISIEMI